MSDSKKGDSKKGDVKKEPCLLFISMLDQTNKNNWRIYKPEEFQLGGDQDDTVFSQINGYTDQALKELIENDKLVVVPKGKNNTEDTAIRYIGFYWNMAIFILDIDPTQIGLNSRVDKAIGDLLTPSSDITKYFWLVIPTRIAQGHATKDMPTSIPQPEFMAGAAGGINMRP